MKIVIDLQALQNQSKDRGIGRYVSSLVKALIKNKLDNEIILLFSSLLPDQIEVIKEEYSEYINEFRIEVWHGVQNGVSYVDKDNNWRRQASEFIREAYIDSLEPDILLIGSLFEGAGDDVVVTVHKLSNIFTAVILFDLIPYIYPKEYLGYHKLSQWYYEKFAYLQKADLILAISESSMLEGIELAHIDPKNIINISASINNNFHEIEVNNLEKNILFSKFNITKPYLMYSGATDIRKNLDRLIEAFSMLPTDIKNTHQLVFAGGMPPEHAIHFKNLAKKYKLNETTLVLTLRVTDREMMLLYNLCKGFILPSYHEGFGLPLLEAMACGAPVIGSNLSSIPEVIGNDAALFDPLSSIKIMTKVEELLTNEYFRNELIIKGKKQLKNFSWDLSAIKTLEKLQSIDFQRNDFKNSSLISMIANLDAYHNDNDLLSCALAISHIKNTLYIDISELYRHDNQSGIQRVVKNVIKNLLSIKLDNYNVKLVYATGADSYRVIHKTIIKNSKLVFDIGNNVYLSDICKSGDIFFGLDFHDRIVYFQKDLYKHMQNLGVKIYFLVYDLLPLKLRQYFNDEIHDNYTLWLETITSNSDGIICISDAVKTELVEWMMSNDLVYKTSRIVVCHLGAEVFDKTDGESFLVDFDKTLEYLANSKTFLSVSTIEPRKGHIQTLLAFEQLWANGIDVNLTIVGKKGWMMDEFILKVQNHPELYKRLFWLEGISDEYLEKIYVASTCLIAASEGEGFGLPLIEAAQHKLPIIARDIPVFREVAGEFAYYFENNNNPNVLVKAIENWINLYQNNHHPKSDNMPWITWEKSTQNFINYLINDQHE